MNQREHLGTRRPHDGDRVRVRGQRPLAPTKVLDVAGRRFLYDRASNGIFEIVGKGAGPVERSTTATGALRPHRLAFADSPSVQIVARSVEFVVTGACNLRCDYCATRERYLTAAGYNDLMDEETALKAVEFVEGHFDRGPLLVKFFGGEPLIGIRVIRSVVQAFESRGIECEKLIATNGLLLDEAIVDFLASKGFLTFISLDGPREVHDAHRKDSQGRGTYEAVVEKIRLIQQRQPAFFRSHVVINLVVSPDQAGRYGENRRHLVDLGISPDQIHPNDTAPTRAECTRYAPAQLRRLRREKGDLRRVMIEELLSGGPFGRKRCDESYCRFSPAAVEAFSPRTAADDDPEDIAIVDCQTGAWQVLTFWPDGKISACIEFDRRPDLVFGDLASGQVDLEKLLAFRTAFRRSVVDGRCATCWAVRYCPHVGCYKLFAENGCRKGWQQEAMCVAIRQDLEQRMEDFLQLKIARMSRERRQRDATHAVG
jgi:uncharacterized protein